MSDEAPESGTRRSRLWRAAETANVPLRAILVTVAVVVVVYLAAKIVVHLRDVLMLFVVAGFIALLLNPLVIALEKVFKRRGTAVTVVTLLAVCAFGGLATAFGYPLVNGISHLADELPVYVSKAEHGKLQQTWVGHLVARYHLQTWVRKNAPKLAGYARNLAKPALSLGKGAASLLFALLTIFVLVVLLLLEGSKMRAGILGLMSPERATRYSAVAREVNRSVTGYMLGNFATSVIAGVVVFVTLTLLGVPFAFLWGLWVGLVDFLPMIGGALAGIPVVLFVAVTQSLSAGIITLVVFLVYTQLENHVLSPAIMSRTVRINPLLVIVAILVGASLGSWIGGLFGGLVAALLAIPLAGAGQVIVRELWQETAPEAQAEAAPAGLSQGTEPQPGAGASPDGGWAPGAGPPDVRPSEQAQPGAAPGPEGPETGFVEAEAAAVVVVRANRPAD